MNPEFCNISIKLLFVNASKDLHGWWKRPGLPTFWRFYWNDKPGAFIEFSEKKHSLTPDKFFLIAPDTAYTASCPGHARQFYIHFLLGGSYASIRGKIFPCAVKGHIPSALLSEGMSVAGSSDAGYSGAFLAMRVLMHAVDAAIPHDFIAGQSIDSRIKKVTDILQTCYADFSNDYLAKQAKLSLSCFIRLFKSETGFSPQQYATREKMKEACRLLQHCDWSIEQIAESLFFNDRYHFSRVFKQICGATPAAYRKKYSLIR